MDKIVQNNHSENDHKRHLLEILLHVIAVPVNSHADDFVIGIPLQEVESQINGPSAFYWSTLSPLFSHVDYLMKWKIDLQDLTVLNHVINGADTPPFGVI